MTYEDESPHATPKMRLIGIVWAVVGVIALVLGLLILHATAIAVFGALALLAGGVVYGVQVAREQSAQRTAQRLAGGPVSPMSAPAPAPAGPATVADGEDGERLYRRRPWLRHEAEEEDAANDDGSDDDGSDDDGSRSDYDDDGEAEADERADDHVSASEVDEDD